VTSQLLPHAILIWMHPNGFDLRRRLRLGANQFAQAEPESEAATCARTSTHLSKTTPMWSRRLQASWHLTIVRNLSNVTKKSIGKSPS
jgi:hypothetical protein